MYQVSCCGSVRRVSHGNNTYPGKILKQTPNSDGYFSVTLYKNGIKSVIKVHTLVMNTFGGIRLYYQEICHNNGNKSDNRFINLRYDTHAANMQDKMNHGHHFQPNNRGERCGTSKLKDANIPIIRQLLKQGIKTQTEIAVIFGVGRKAISDIKTGKTWRCI